MEILIATFELLCFLSRVYFLETDYLDFEAAPQTAMYS